MIRLFIFFICCCFTNPAIAAGAGSTTGDSSSGQAGIEQFTGSLPVCFIENQGQVDSDEVAFYVKGADRTLYFTSRGLTIAMTDREGGEVQRWTMTVEFEGTGRVAPRGENRQETMFSYFKGKPSEWKTGLPAFSRIVYDNLWPGIDLVYSGAKDELKYEFVVSPGTDPSVIRLVYRGATEVFLKETGELEATCPAGVFEDGLPFAYQVIDGKRREVSVRFSLDASAAKGAAACGFELGDFDAGEELVLDPVIHVYCGYIGGSNGEQGHAVAVDSQGSAYVAGETWSDEASFPVSVGPDLTFNGGTYDAFVAKVNTQGTGFDYCGYIGGASDEYGYGIAVDGQGNAYVTGLTYSDEATFPVLGGPDLTYNGYYDAFVARVNAQGTALDYCGYIGGDSNDYGRGISVDGQGRAHVAGETRSDETTFPATVGPDITHNGNYDVFVTRVNAQGTGLDFCGYIGGANDDYGNGISLDGQDCAYVAGDTSSDELTFPVTVGPDLTFNGATAYGGDAFVAKVNLQGTGFDYCGYIGGIDQDHGESIAVDVDGHAYLTGYTKSDETTFPVAVGPDLTFNGYSYEDAFVARVNAQGTGFDFCGYIGGDFCDYGHGVALDSQDNVYVAGWTESPETNGFPVTVGPDLTFNGYQDAFVTRIEYTAGPLLQIQPDPLVAGQAGTFAITNGLPNANAWLGYSLVGPGSYWIPSLNVTLDLTNPILGFGPKLTNATGTVIWTAVVPTYASGKSIWLQGVQYGQTTNVVPMTIQ